MEERPSPTTAQLGMGNALPVEYADRALKTDPNPIGLASVMSSRRFTYFLLVALVAAWAFGFWQWTAKRQLQADLALAGGEGAPSRSVFWSRLFDPRRATYIVAADSSWCLLQRLAGREFSLDDYVHRRPVSGLNTRELTMIARGEYTNKADLRVIWMLHAAAPPQVPATIRFARDVSMEDLRLNNFILLGGTCSNPWGQLFVPMGSFREEQHLASDLDCYVNKDPASGESTNYCNQGVPGGLRQSYCLISFVPNLSGSGNGLIISGTTGEGTQAGGEFLISPGLDSRLREYLNLHSQETPVPYFELLLKVSGLENGALRAEYVTHRILTVGKN